MNIGGAMKVQLSGRQILTKYRIMRGLKQEELAAAISSHGFKMNRQQITRRENGKTSIKAHEWQAFAEILDIPVEEVQPCL